MFINEQFAPSGAGRNGARAAALLFRCDDRRAPQSSSKESAASRHCAITSPTITLLGQLVTDRGLRVVLSSYVVENVIDEPGFKSLWARELRWSRTIRSVRPLGHAFSFLTFGLPLAALATLAARGRYGTPYYSHSQAAYASHYISKPRPARQCSFRCATS